MVKLVYDKYENEVGVIYDADIENDHTKILEQLPTKINDIEINTDRVININTWGIKKPFSKECDIIFDLTFTNTFHNYIDTPYNNSIHKYILDREEIYSIYENNWSNLISFDLKSKFIF